MIDDRKVFHRDVSMADKNKTTRKQNFEKTKIFAYVRPKKISMLLFKVCLVFTINITGTDIIYTLLGCMKVVESELIVKSMF
jgi:hypothetical protein